jgi:hypothetical protein
MKKLICLLFVAVVLPADAQPQKAERSSQFVDGSKLNGAEQQAFRQRLLERLRSRSNDRQEFFGLSGPVVSYTACPVGYVRNADYDVSIKEVAIVRDEGVDCDEPGQCRAWQVEISPEDDQRVYDFSIRLQCSTDDTLSSPSRTGVNRINLPAAPRRPGG